MSSEWPLVRLADHVDACLGKMLDAKKNKGVPQPYLGNSNVRWGAFDLADLAEMRFEPHEEDRYGLAPGDLVVCEGGEPGRCAIWTAPVPGMKIQKALHRIRPKATLNNYYLYYWFCHASKAGLLEPYFTGTTIKHLTGKAIAALDIPLPPVETQAAMVDVLRRLDDRIALLRETNATLEAIAQALFKSWFVDFDPVRAKQQGLAPEGMDEATAALFPDGFDESELGLVPKGWRVRPLDSVATFLNGLALQKFPPEEDGGLPVIKIAQLRKGDTTGADRASRYIKPEYIIQNGDVLFSWSGSLEVEVWCGGVGALNQHLFKVTSNSFPKWFYLYWTRHYLPQFQQIAASKATTMGHIQRIHLTQALVLIPPPELVDAMSAVFSPLVDQLIANAGKTQTLTILRDTLLPRLISGQLRVPNTDISENNPPMTAKGVNPVMTKRSVSELHFVKGRDPKPTVEVQAESLEGQGLYVGQVVESVLSRFAEKNPNIVATVYMYGTPSVTFHEQGWSEFLIVAGDERVLKALGSGFSSLSGVKSRYSDYVSPTQGNCAYHIEDGTLWEPEDALTWSAVQSENNSDTPGDSVDDEGEETDDDDGWGDVIGETEQEVGVAESLNEETAGGRAPEQAARYRAARSDARVASIRQTIEEVFGLPAGSVALCGPDGRALRGDAFIRTLRRRWEEA